MLNFSLISRGQRGRRPPSCPPFADAHLLFFIVKLWDMLCFFSIESSLSRTTPFFDFFPACSSTGLTSLGLEEDMCREFASPRMQKCRHCCCVSLVRARSDITARSSEPEHLALIKCHSSQFPPFNRRCRVPAGSCRPPGRCDSYDAWLIRRLSRVSGRANRVIRLRRRDDSKVRSWRNGAPRYHLRGLYII